MNVNNKKRKILKISNQLRNMIKPGIKTTKKSSNSSFKTPIRQKQNSLSTIVLNNKKISEKSLKEISKITKKPRTTKEILKDLSTFQNNRRKKNLSFIQRVKPKKQIRSRTKTKSFAYPSRSGNKENSDKGIEIEDTISNKSFVSEVKKIA